MILLLAACDLSGSAPPWEKSTSSTEEVTVPEDSAAPTTDSSATTPEDPTDPSTLDTCPAPSGCISLAEAESRGDLDISLQSSLGGSTLRIQNRGDQDVCIDTWFVFLSTGSQDAIAGHDPASVLSPDGAVYFYYGDWTWEEAKHPWYCIEHNQYTSEGETYSFNGALAPDALVSILYREGDADLDGVEDHIDWGTNGTVTQEFVWDYLQTNPTVIVGRGSNYLNLAPGGVDTVSIEATNLGREPALAMVTEVLPPELEYLGGDHTPSEILENPDGSTTLVFPVKLDAAIDSTDYDNPAIYDTERIAFEVRARTSCAGRVLGNDLRAEWRDAAGLTEWSYGQGLMIECCAQPVE